MYCWCYVIRQPHAYELSIKKNSTRNLNIRVNFLLTNLVSVSTAWCAGGQHWTKYPVVSALWCKYTLAPLRPPHHPVWISNWSVRWIGGEGRLSRKCYCLCIAIRLVIACFILVSIWVIHRKGVTSFTRSLVPRQRFQDNSWTLRNCSNAWIVSLQWACTKMQIYIVIVVCVCVCCGEKSQVAWKRGYHLDSPHTTMRQSEDNANPNTGPQQSYQLVSYLLECKGGCLSTTHFPHG